MGGVCPQGWPNRLEGRFPCLYRFTKTFVFPTIKTPDIFLRKGERRFKKAFVTIFPARKGFFAANREKTRRIFLLFAKEVYGAEF